MPQVPRGHLVSASGKIVDTIRANKAGKFVLTIFRFKGESDDRKRVQGLTSLAKAQAMHIQLLTAHGMLEAYQQQPGESEAWWCAHEAIAREI